MDSKDSSSTRKYSYFDKKIEKLYCKEIFHSKKVPLTKLGSIGTKMNNTRIYRMSFAGVYPHYIQKAEKKGRSKAEVDEIIFWLTGYNETSLKQLIADKIDFEHFFSQAPHLNSNSSKITGIICGYRIEHIEDPLVQKVRYLDKLIDELAKGKPMEKILRK